MFKTRMYCHVAGQGKYYALNVPLQNGITDEVYQALFRPVIAKVVEVFRPETIVLQCGKLLS